MAEGRSEAAARAPPALRKDFVRVDVEGCAAVRIGLVFWIVRTLHENAVRRGATSSSQFSAGVNMAFVIRLELFHVRGGALPYPLPPPMLPILNGRTIGTRTCGFSSPRFSLR